MILGNDLTEPVPSLFPPMEKAPIDSLIERQLERLRRIAGTLRQIAEFDERPFVHAALVAERPADDLLSHNRRFAASSATALAAVDSSTFATICASASVRTAFAASNARRTCVACHSLRSFSCS
jgi:hypothetical protein